MNNLYHLPLDVLIFAVGLAFLATWRYARAMRPACIDRATPAYRLNYYITTANGLCLFVVIALMAVHAAGAIIGG